MCSHSVCDVFDMISVEAHVICVAYQGLGRVLIKFLWLHFSRALVTHVLYSKLPSIRILDCLEHFLSVTSRRLNPLNRLWAAETKLSLSRFGLK